MSSNRGGAMGRFRKKYYDSSDDDDDEYSYGRRSQEIPAGDNNDDSERKPPALPNASQQQSTAAPDVDEKSLYKRSSELIDRSSHSIMTVSPNIKSASRKTLSSSQSANSMDEKALYKRSSDLIDQSSISLHSGARSSSEYPSLAPGTSSTMSHSVPPAEDEKALYRRSSDLIDQTSSRRTRSEMPVPAITTTTAHGTSQSVSPGDEKSLYRRSSDLIDSSSRRTRSEIVTPSGAIQASMETAPMPINKDIEEGIDEKELYDSIVERSRAAAMAAMSKNVSFSERSKCSSVSGSAVNGKAAYIPEPTSAGQRRVPEPGAEFVRSRAMGMRPSQFISQVRHQNTLPHVEAALVQSMPVVASQPCEPLRAPEEAPPDTTLKSHPRKWKFLIVAVVAGGLIAVALGVTFGMEGKGSGGSNGSQPTATVFSPLTTDCNSLSSQQNPHVFSQCYCNGNVTKVAADVGARYDNLVSFLIPDVFPKFNDTIRSCSPQNQALLWLASGDGYLDPSTGKPELRRRFILAFLFEVWGGLNWKVSDGWLSLVDECTWYGVVCGEENTLDSLLLSNNSLVGQLAPAFPFLTDLARVSLDGNDFHGSALPPDVGSMTNLRTLRLNATGIHGAIPRQLFNLSKTLEYVDVADNWITGTIPSLVGNLRHIQVWNVYQNNISGAIPHEIWNCSNLTTLDLSSNHLWGTLPSSIGSLTALEVLNLDRNNVTGMIPTEIGLCTSLINLDVGNNQLHGTVPSEIGHLSELQYISLENNTLSGTIPAYISNCSQILSFDVSDNRLNGSVPEELGLLNMILYFDIKGNNFSAFLPKLLCGQYNNVCKQSFHCYGCSCTVDDIAAGVDKYQSC